MTAAAPCLFAVGGWWKAWLGSTAGIWLVLILSITLSLMLFGLFAWAFFLRKPRHHHHRPSQRRYPTPPTKDDKERKENRRRRRFRRRRHEEFSANPTRAEVGGLPPPRDDKSSPLPPA
jgi:hypothetical protein